MPYKITFLGLDYAGKTSILTILEGCYSGLDQIKPTKGIKRTHWEILGFEIINWDLAGQKKFRAKYLTDYKQILDQINLVVFVVDVQDDHRFNEAGAYFDDILNALDKLNIRCPIIICLHKCDPDIISSASMITKLNWVTNLFSEYSQQHDVEIKVFITSIFDQKSLIEMFSYGIGKFVPIGILSQFLDKFLSETEELGMIGTILLDTKFFIIGSAFSDLHSKDVCFGTINAFSTLVRDFKLIYKEEDQINFGIDINNSENHKFKLEKIIGTTSPYYLLIMGNESVRFENIISLFHKKYVPKIEKGLTDLIESID